jgi:hypothetical protein
MGWIVAAVVAVIAGVIGFFAGVYYIGRNMFRNM